MDEKMIKATMICPHCGAELNSWYRGNYRGRYFNEKRQILRPKIFCTEDCYKDYKKDFVIEIYDSRPIYCVGADGEKRYMPYFEADYYFTNIDDCKNRMDMKGVAVMNGDVFRWIWEQF